MTSARHTQLGRRWRCCLEQSASEPALSLCIRLVLCQLIFVQIIAVTTSEYKLLCTITITGALTYIIISVSYQYSPERR